jgi:hypothetical protein
MTQLFVDTLANEAGTGPTELTGQSAAKAWVSWNGTPSVLENLNISGVTDTGAGQFTFSLTNSMSSANYSSVASSNQGRTVVSSDPKTSEISTDNFNTAATFSDNAGSLVAHGTLA